MLFAFLLFYFYFYGRSCPSSGPENHGEINRPWSYTVVGGRGGGSSEIIIIIKKIKIPEVKTLRINIFGLFFRRSRIILILFFRSVKLIDCRLARRPPGELYENICATTQRPPLFITTFYSAVSCTRKFTFP